MMMNRSLKLFVALALAMSLPASASSAPPAPAGADAPTLHPRIRLETSLGAITLELDAEKAPVTVLNFIAYAKSGFYDGLIFHRVIPGFMIQGGGMKADMKNNREGMKEPILNEWRNGLFNKRGTIAMARLPQKPDSATCEFFINLRDNDMLDQPNDGAGYAVFGKVIEGMETVDKIKDVATRGYKGYEDVPIEPVVIQTVQVLDGFAEAAAQKAADEEIKAFRDYSALKDSGNQDAIVPSVVRLYETQTHQKITKTPSGLMYIVMREGNGPIPGPDDTIQAHFVGRMLNGFGILGSYGVPPAEFQYKTEIPAWREALGAMKVGEKRALIVPPHLGYGNKEYMNIPPNSWLIYEIELMGIKTTPPQAGGKG